MNPFKEGVCVFFRILTPVMPGQTEAQLARSMHPNGRDVQVDKPGFENEYIVYDEEGIVIGIYPKDWIAAILPMRTQGPANAQNQQTPLDRSSEAEERDTESQPRRAKRFNN